MTHARPARRAREVMDWVRSCDFNRNIDGEYPRRGDPIDLREHTDAAQDHYAERFRGVMRDAADGIAGAGDQLADWLRRDQPPSSD